jgi:SAM-dependent methyltransferase
MGTAVVQSQLWGVRARDWADVQEGTFAPLFATVLDQAGTGAGTTVLDIGCGSGLFCQLAAQRGAQVCGLDASEPLLGIARERVPLGNFRTGEMEELPYPERSFDLVTGFNSFQFAADPVNALREAQRVTRPNGKLVIGVFGSPQDCDARAYFAALGSLLPPPPAGTPGPFALSVDGALEALVTSAGMQPGKAKEIDIPWEYPDDSTMLRGLLASGPGTRAIQLVGEDTAAKAISHALAPFKTTSGGYRLNNKARYMIVKFS